MFIYGGGLADSYLKRRELAGSPEVQADDWYRRKLREKAPENPEFRKMLAREAMARVAEGYDKDDVEREWGLRSGLEPAAYDLIADLAADIATWGIYSGTRQAGKMLARGLREPAERALIKPAAKEMGKLFTQEIGLGFTAGASIFLAQEIGASPILEMLSGFVGPTAAAGVATLTRKGLATWMRRLKRNNDGLYNRIITAAQDDADNEFARVVREYELGGPPWKPRDNVYRLMNKEEWKNIKNEKTFSGRYWTSKLEEVKDLGDEGDIIAVSEPIGRKIWSTSQREKIEKGEAFFHESQLKEFKEIKGAYQKREGKWVKVWGEGEPELKLPEPEPPKPPGPREKILDLEGPSTIDDALEIMRDDIQKGKPDWFTGKGWTKKQVTHAMEKKQGPIYDELRKIAQSRTQQEALEKAWITAMGDPNKPIIGVREVQSEIETWTRFTLEERPERYINLNPAKFNQAEDIQDALAKTAKLFEPEIQQMRRGKMTLKMQEEYADKCGYSLKDLINRRAGQALNPEEIIKSGKLLDASAFQLVELAKKASGPLATDIDKFAFAKMFNLHYALQAQFSGAVAEAGRTLGALRTVFEGSARIKEIKEMLETFQGTVPIEKMSALIATLPTTQAVTVTVREARKATTWDMFLEAWINGLLSGPQTHVVNTGSNFLFALWQIPERYLAAGISKVTPGPQEIFGGEAMAQAWGAVNGIRDGLKLMGKALKEGEPSDVLSKVEVRRYRAITGENLGLAGTAGRAVDFLGEGVRMPGRFLMAEDEFFKSVGYRMELHAQAYRQAAMEGLEGKDFAKRVGEILADPPENIHLAAQNAARYQTYTNELGKAGKYVQGALNEIPVLRLIVPFFRTGSNIAKAVQERSPLALLSRRFYQDFAAGGARRDMALGRFFAGSMLMASMAPMAAAGYLTGAGPPDKAGRAAKRRMGWQSYSFCPNPDAPIEERRYIRFSRIDPFGAFLGLVADSVEIMSYADEVTAEEIAAMVSMAIAENVSSKTWIKGITDFIEAWSDPKRYMDDYLKRMSGTLIPTGVATIERTIHPQFHDAQNWLDQIKSRIPGLSKDVPPPLDLWGEPITGGTIRGEDGNWLWIPVDMLNPLYVSKGKRSPIDEEIYRNSISLGKPRNIIENVKLTPEEHKRYIELQGKVIKDENTNLNLKQTLDLIVDNPRKAMALGLTYKPYDQMTEGPEGERATVIKRTVEHFRKIARRQLRIEYPELDALIQEMRKKRSGLPREMMGGIQ